jgi:GR25 family glycosyltransferase involved in LPS biosynthesis
VISLYDQVKKFEKVEKQFKNRGIKVDRFIAIDGRCKKEGDKACKDKLNSFEIRYDVKISNKKKLPLKELVPASSLTIGTILLLRKMVKERWDHILICEDDIELTRGFEQKFKQGIKEIGNNNWDILYLGCGSKCGTRGVSEEKYGKTKYLSEVGQIYDWEYYVSVKNDLRHPADDCEIFSDNISIPSAAGGTWCYAYSLAGAKKVLKLIGDDAGNHIDQILSKNMGYDGKIKALSFDPPIVYHERIINREGSSIPWSW